MLISEISLFVIESNVWNSLPEDTVTTYSLNSF